MKNTHIAIFASGSGTNALNINKYFKHNNNINIDMIIVNTSLAGIVESAKKENLVVEVVNSLDTDSILKLLKDKNITHIVLAGYLKKIPLELINVYKDKIINIHPSLLPKYGGKGMYGINVHNAVILNKEPYSGITIHLVNEDYDKGEILLQTKIPVRNEDTPTTLAKRILHLEWQYFPQIIEQWINNF